MVAAAFQAAASIQHRSIVTTGTEITITINPTAITARGFVLW
jgi:hypothetical protein